MLLSSGGVDYVDNAENETNNAHKAHVSLRLSWVQSETRGRHLRSTEEVVTTSEEWVKGVKDPTFQV